LELNHIFLFIAVISPLLVLAHAWRPSARYHGWRIAAVIVLVITAVAWLFWRSAAGYIGSSAWFLLLFIPAVGLRKMTQLAAERNYTSARRLATALQILHPSSELRDQVQLLRDFESKTTFPIAATSPPPAYQRVRGTRFIQFRHAPGVFILIVVNVIAFLFEISAGDWSDPEVLHRVGALDAYSVIVQHEYWRLFTALFLHGGLLHLGFNVFALYVLGPALEQSIGTLRFAVCYLISGLASGAGVVALTFLGLVQPAQLVGASGAIMGIVGAWAGFLLRHWHAPTAKQRLGNVAMIVVIQIAFDLSTPQVSMAAHMCGLVAGFVLGLVLVPRYRKYPR
jgi:membrane associated rhomboid family serine protease